MTEQRKTVRIKWNGPPVELRLRDHVLNYEVSAAEHPVTLQPGEQDVDAEFWSQWSAKHEGGPLAAMAEKVDNNAEEDERRAQD